MGSTAAYNEFLDQQPSATTAGARKTFGFNVNEYQSNRGEAKQPGLQVLRFLVINLCDCGGSGYSGAASLGPHHFLTLQGSKKYHVTWYMDENTERRTLNHLL